MGDTKVQERDFLNIAEKWKGWDVEDLNQLTDNLKAEQREVVVHKKANMGRRLSDIQKDILSLAYRQWCNGKTLSYRDAMSTIFKWTHRHSSHLYANNQVFCKNEIGCKEYDKIHSSFSRSVRRLEERGLIWRKWYMNRTVIHLTTTGIELARNLSVKWVAEGDRLNPYKGISTWQRSKRDFRSIGKRLLRWTLSVNSWMKELPGKTIEYWRETKSKN